jgi:alkaline phosphatase D
LRLPANPAARQEPTMHNRKTRTTGSERRRFLDASWSGVAGTLALALMPGRELRAAPRLGTNPFTLGVASGDPQPDGAVLWTRLAPRPAEPTALGDDDIPVHWRVAVDPHMRHVVAHGMAAAVARLAHSVHVEVEGLRASADYFYQFHVRGEESRVGHFRTAPERHEENDRMRFAFVTCQDWPSGYYTAYRDMLQFDLDLVLHLGDYTYEYAFDSTRRQGTVVPVGFTEETVDLRTYRLRHALHKLDPDLQAAHARFPFAVIWDDHEVANDYSGLAPEFALPSPEFTARRTAAYQAYYEHMPIRERDAKPQFRRLRIHRRLRYGRLADISLLDDRQYRSDNPCGDGESLRCAAALGSEPTMLGREQEQWLAEGLGRSRARWNIVAQQLLVAQLEHTTVQPNWFWNDAWDGYPAARARLLGDVVRSGARNPIFLTGDWHSTFVNDLKLDFGNPASPTIATEFVTPAITTGGDGTPYGPYYGPMVPYNPHIKYYEGDRRGYFKAELTRSHAQFDLRFVTSVERPNGSGYPERSWIVMDGKPGASMV